MYHGVQALGFRPYGVMQYDSAIQADSFGQNHKEAKFCLIYMTLLIMDIYQRL